MWAIRNKRTRKWLYGTDYSGKKIHQRTSEDRCMVFETQEIALAEMRWRKCGVNYEAVPVRVEVLE